MKVAIVGAAPSSRDLAPYGDQSWEIWGCSPSNLKKLPRVTAWFELHSLEDFRSERWAEWRAPYFEHLNSLSCPVYMQEKNEFTPNAAVFPKDEMIAKFGGDFFTSSIGWMMAFAMHKGAEEIGIYGVDMATGGEYEYERPGAKYWISLARSRGVKVTIPPQSDLDAPIPLYGYGDANPVAIKLKAHAFELQGRIDDLTARIEASSRERGRMLEERAHLSGALEQNIYTRRTFLAWSGKDA